MSTSKRRVSFRPAVENLEVRLTPAVSTGYDGTTDTLTLRSNTASDTVVISHPDQQVLTRVRVVVNNVSLGSFNSVERLVFTGDGGNDKVTNNTSLTMNATGDAGSDTLIGGGGKDTLNGGSGADSIVGNAGDDSLVGGTGNDTMKGGSGKDRLKGDGDHDDLFGGADDDSLEGGTGNDELFGEDGMDFLWGQDGDDDLAGGNDMFADVLHGGFGADDFRIDPNFALFFANQSVVDFSAAHGDQNV
jgi:Ca2+-binding RTX toxin-like protein